MVDSNLNSAHLDLSNYYEIQIKGVAWAEAMRVGGGWG